MVRTQPQDAPATLQATSPATARDRPDNGRTTAAGKRSNLRLDPGHHRSESRWLPGDGRVRPRRGPAAPAPRCLPVVDSREARLLAAMVNWIAGDEAAASGPCDAPGPSIPDASIEATSPRALVSVGGRTPGARSGLVEFWPTIPSAGDYLLTHAEVDAVGPIPPGSTLVERYSMAPGATWWGADLKRDAGRYRFRAFRAGVYHAEVRLRVAGVHQVLPALAALAIGCRLDLPAREVAERLGEFPGIRRGFESRGTYRGATLVDDEASRPGELGDALRLVREVFGRRTIRAVYLAADPADLPPARDFDEADHLILVEPAGSDRESTRLLGASLRSSGASVAICPTPDGATRVLDRDLEPGDVLVTLGAAEVGTIADAFLRRLSRDRHG